MKIFLIAAILMSVCAKNCAQHFEISTIEISGLIAQWDFANNSHSSKSFDLVYGDTLLFYTQTLGKAKCILLKEKLFQKHPGFKQRITSEIIYTPYTSGVVKCDFIKEVYRRSNWVEFPSYLLVSYQNSEYKIVGESDNATDKTLNFFPDLGEPMEVGMTEKTEFSKDLSDTTRYLEQPGAHSALPSRNLNVTNPANDDPAKARKEVDRNTAAISKDQVYILIGILAAGSVLIFFLYSRIKKSKIKTEKSDFVTKLVTEDNDDLQTTFCDFIITLFDPLHFRINKLTKNTGIVDQHDKLENFEHLEIEVRNIESKIKLTALSVYYITEDEAKIKTLIAEFLPMYSQSSLTNAYSIIGTGGKADDPDKIFLIPLSEINPEQMTIGDLRQFQKWGMFFYRIERSRLV